MHANHSRCAPTLLILGAAMDWIGPRPLQGPVQLMACIPIISTSTEPTPFTRDRSVEELATSGIGGPRTRFFISLIHLSRHDFLLKTDSIRHVSIGINVFFGVSFFETG
jgi:hypothetical protein